MGPVGIAIIIVLVLAAWYGGWITLWVVGHKKKSKGMVFAGAILTLWIIGLIVAIVTTSQWIAEDDRHSKWDVERQKLELEKAKFEFEKQKYESENKGK